MGNSTTDVTSYHPGMHYWSRENLPNILYMLEPPKSWDKFRVSGRPRQKRDSNGQRMYERWPKDPNKPRMLLDFPILPDQIGTKEEWWVLIAMKRYDPRIHSCDIEMRMETENRPNWNAIQTRITRNWIPKFAMISWHVRGRYRKDRPNPARDAVLARLSQEQRNAQSTRGTTPGLISPELGEAGGRVPWPTLKDGEGEARVCRKRTSNLPQLVTGVDHAPMAAPSASSGALHHGDSSSSLTSTITASNTPADEALIQGTSSREEDIDSSESDTLEVDSDDRTSSNSHQHRRLSGMDIPITDSEGELAASDFNGRGIDNHYDDIDNDNQQEVRTLIEGSLRQLTDAEL